MPAADSYGWRTAPCPECADPAALLVPGDSDRADILLCTRCPMHNRLPYRDPADIRAHLPFRVVLAMRGGALRMASTPRRAASTRTRARSWQWPRKTGSSPFGDPPPGAIA